MIRDIRGGNVKHVRAIFLMFMAAPAMAQRSTIATPSVTITPAPISLAAEFHPGETVHYTFSLKTNLTSRVGPNVSPDQVLSFTPRQYQVEGEIVATFAATQPGEPLHGTVQFQGLTVKNWVSTAKVGDLEAHLHQLEATPSALTTAANGTLELGEMAASTLNSLYGLDAEDLHSIAQALLISRISNDPLAPGQQRTSADFPLPGMIKPGIKMTVLTEYITDVPIAGHPSAEVRLSMNIPTQFQTVPSEVKTTKLFEQLQGSGDWTYLLDLDAHQISFLHKTIRSETSYNAESADNNETVRIPANLFTINKQYEVTARRVATSARPEREADLATFERSLAAPSPTAAEGAGTTAAASPGAEGSLGDIARRLRAERAAQSSPQAVTTLQESAATAGSGLAGFKPGTFLNGDLTELAPDQATEVQKTSDYVTLRAYVGNPRATVTISIFERTFPQASSPDDILDGTVATLRARPGSKVLRSEKKTINGAPGVVTEVQLDLQGQPFQALDATVISGSKALGTTCGSAPSDFARIKTICQTVVESITPRQ